MCICTCVYVQECYFPLSYNNEYTVPVNEVEED